jgi:hypothetical protein
VKWLDLVGWAGSALLVWSLLQTRILRLRVLNLLGCLVLIYFNGALRIWPMVGLNVVLAIINIVYMLRLISSRHDDQVYSVVEVGSGDAILAHVLQVHQSDIASFNPGFVRRPDGLAFVIMRGDDMAGVMLVHDAGNGVAQIDLDYVTQRFRDFSPGYFVFKRSGLLKQHGFTRVHTPPGMVEPYYAKLGFRPSGDHYTFDLP